MDRLCECFVKFGRCFDESLAVMETILQLLREKDSFAAVEYPTRQPDALAAVEVLDEAMRDLYWKQKDLSGAVALGRAAAQHALTMCAALESANPDLAMKLRGKAKAVCYNLASFTWRGWGEKGISITPSDEAIGFDAARTNLRLAVELNKGDLPMSRAFWMLGGHQISKADYSAALNSFQKAVDFARLAAEPGEEALALAFVRLTEFLAAPSDNMQPIVRSLQALADVKDGPAFMEQLSTALEIFRHQHI